MQAIEIMISQEQNNLQKGKMILDNHNESNNYFNTLEQGNI